MYNIVFLASFPKSGNTWLRTFITNLINEKDEEISINQLKTDGIYSSRMIVDAVTGIETTDLSPDEADKRRPKVYHYLAENLHKNLYIKAHDAYTYLEDGTPLIATVHTKAIYIMRNPLDVAVSFANHISKDLDTAIEMMGNRAFCFCRNENSAQPQLRQKLLSWSLHVESWAQARGIEVCLIRYEDMKLNPMDTFQRVVSFIGLDSTQGQIEEAIQKSDFHVLREQEQKHGFRERLSPSHSFFRKGEVGDWRNHLSAQQVMKIIRDHQETMEQYGYLDGEGNPVY